MPLIALGSNLVDADGRSPRDTCEAALDAMARRGLRATALSRWYETAPVPASEQPWFVNAVVRVESRLSPSRLMASLHDIETAFGRVRSLPNAARTIDLDLLDADGIVSGADEWPVLPHPRLWARAFVLCPLRDVAPGWRHPVSGASVGTMIDRLGALDGIRLLRCGRRSVASCP